jgi:hypothetical protein
MKSNGELYFRNVVLTVTLLLSITAVATLVAAWGFGLSGWRPLAAGGSFSVIVVLFVCGPLVHAWTLHEILEYSNERMELQADAAIARGECERERAHNARFASAFPVPQAQVDAALTLAAADALAACGNAFDLYRRGVDGFRGSFYEPAPNPGQDLIGAKQSFEAERVKREAEVRAAILRFGDLWDLAQARGYAVKKCWPEYVGLSSDDPATRPNAVAADESEPPADPAGPQHAD